MQGSKVKMGWAGPMFKLHFGPFIILGFNIVEYNPRVLEMFGLTFLKWDIR